MISLLDYLAGELSLDKKGLSSYIMTAPHRYKVYSIPKRKPREYRTIAQPAKALKAIQRAALPMLGDLFKVHECATGYISGKGIKNNAEIHKTNDYILKMDFKNFFPSIVPKDLIHLASHNNLDLSNEEKYWSRLFFFKPKSSSELRLSIGAPSSPFISNAVMITFDEEISKYCQNAGISYSRYADDLTFSTSVKDLLFEVPNTIEQSLNKLDSPKLRINSEKTVFSSKKHNRHVTGLVLTNHGRVSLGRHRKRVISAMIHKRTIGLLSESELQRLQGLLAFAMDIEPNFVERMKLKYGEQTIVAALKDH